MHIGLRIKNIRESKNMQSKDLALASGFSPAYMSELEGKESCPTNTLEKICNALNISLSYFFSDEEESTPYDRNDKLFQLLKDIGLDYLILCKEMKEKGISPEELRKSIKYFEDLGLLNKK